MPPLNTYRSRWLSRGSWLAGIAIFCIAWPALEYSGLDIEPQQRAQAFLQLAILHGSWLLWPLLAQSVIKAVLRIRKGRTLRAAGATVLAIFCVVLCYARFVAPNLLIVRRTVIPAPINLDIAVVADVHLGIYTRRAKLRQMVDKLNALHVDLVLFAGDLTYDPPNNLAAALSPLKKLNKPMYAVLGNHDVQLPGPPLAKKIHRILAASPVHFIEHRVIDFPTFRLAGLYDWWSARDNAAFLQALPYDKPLLVLMHQPHSLRALRRVDFTLALAGHTHGGQVYIPWLTDRLFLLVRDEKYINGYYDTPAGKLFVTPGVGITGVPLRFDCPPTIDVLELRRHGRGRGRAGTGLQPVVRTRAHAPTTPTGSSRRDDPAAPLTQGG